MIATKLHVDHFNEVRLDEERNAVILRVESAPGEEKVWVVGTHLNDFDGLARNREMTALLQEVPAEAYERVLICRRSESTTAARLPTRRMATNLREYDETKCSTR
mmetsp:Transcript_3779/g.6974  ORF Transcript_3779/g.6974 Transcript_3779/m.6974 type:complete len:105 (+) Transcript_3779:205-519(+)